MELNYHWKQLPRFVKRLYQHELRALIVLLLLAASVWLFAEIADEVSEGSTRAFDQAVLLAMRNPADRTDPLGPPWVEELGRDFTALGGTGILTLWTAAAVGYLWLRRRRKLALLTLAAIGGALMLSYTLKSGFDRPRPDLVPHGSYVYSASFPSGHSIMSAATYLTLGTLLVSIQPRRRLKAYILSLAIVMTLLVGVSRVYLGVHWPTDVLAGWAVGAAWGMFCWLAAYWLKRCGRAAG